MTRPTREEAQPIAAEVERMMSERGMTQSQLARLCGVTPQAVGSWFSKGVLITPSTLNIMETAWGIRKGSILARCGLVDFESTSPVPESIEADPNLDSGQRRLLNALYFEFTAET